jgi:hypothetical protein
MSSESSGESDGEWRADPTGRYGYRLWDGDRWTDRVSKHGVRSVDPMGVPDETSSAPSPLRGAPQLAVPEPATERTADISRGSWIEGTGRAGAVILAFGSLMVLLSGFLNAAHPPAGTVAYNSFNLNDTAHGSDLIFPALVMLFFSLALFRSYPSRGVSWTAVVIAAGTLAYAIKIRSDSGHLMDNASNFGLKIPLTSSLHLAILSAAICLVGGLWCVRADGPIRRAHATGHDRRRRQ